MKTTRTTEAFRKIIAVSVLLCATLLALPGTIRAAAPQARPGAEGSFFIISSVDAAKQEIVLKLPTEVTEVVRITPATTYRDGKGQPLKFADLRAGDTVYAEVVQSANGTPAAVSIRRGPMTTQELRQRYLEGE